MLAEHFDSVQIIAFRQGREDHSERYANGCGSWYERIGGIELWVAQEREFELERTRRRAREPDEE